MCRRVYLPATNLPSLDSPKAMEGLHNLLLLRNDIARFRFPYVLLVSQPFSSYAIPIRNDTRFGSMRYSRMLEESSFANRKADYFWLLFLSSIMLLVSPIVSTKLGNFRAYKCYRRRLTANCLFPFTGIIPFGEPALPLLSARLRADIPVVQATPLDARFPVRPHYNHRALPPSRACRSVMDTERHMESGCRRSSRVRSRSCRMVRTRRLDARDDGGPDHPQRPSRSFVRVLDLAPS